MNLTRYDFRTDRARRYRWLVRFVCWWLGHDPATVTSIELEPFDVTVWHIDPDAEEVVAP